MLALPSKCHGKGAWVAQSVRHPPSVQVMVLCPGFEPCSSGSLLFSLSLCLSLSQISKILKKKNAMGTQPVLPSSLLSFGPKHHYFLISSASSVMSLPSLLEGPRPSLLNTAARVAWVESALRSCLVSAWSHVWWLVSFRVKAGVFRLGSGALYKVAFLLL